MTASPRTVFVAVSHGDGGLFFCVWQSGMERKNLLTGNGKQIPSPSAGRATQRYLWEGRVCVCVCVQAHAHMRAQVSL